ncbi:UNVERIFIED_CONTAM: RNA-binding protein 1 [Sesamum radiatum]|uniref:RNA-binding protein 1 n=1 Tax=Sesamum radiatum TaxID=300843 RepID=A0AAW2TFA5_SESRA
MADAYWRYGEGRQQPAALTPHVVKRPRSDYEMPSGHDLSGYYAREDDRGGLRIIRDTDSINASYDRYLRSTQMPSYGGDSGRSMSSGLGGHHHVDDPRVMAVGGSEPAAVPKIRPIGVEGVQPEISLPPDASSTLFVEGLPANCTRREPGGDPLVLCFVDFQSPAHAATAMDALQGYKFDEHDRDSAHLRIQFARHHGARLERLLLMAVSVLLKAAIGQQIVLNVKQRFFVGPTGFLGFQRRCWLSPRRQLVDWAQDLLQSYYRFLVRTWLSESIVAILRSLHVLVHRKQNLNLVEVLMKVRAEELKGAGGIGRGSDIKLMGVVVFLKVEFGSELCFPSKT